MYRCSLGGVFNFIVRAAVSGKVTSVSDSSLQNCNACIGELKRGCKALFMFHPFQARRPAAKPALRDTHPRDSEFRPRASGLLEDVETRKGTTYLLEKVRRVDEAVKRVYSIILYEHMNGNAPSGTEGENQVAL